MGEEVIGERKVAETVGHYYTRPGRSSGSTERGKGRSNWGRGTEDEDRRGGRREVRSRGEYVS